MIYRGVFYPAVFLFPCERSFENAWFCVKLWLFSSRRLRKLILSFFSKSKRPFDKQTTPRLVTYQYLTMDKIWGKTIFWLWPRNFDFARFLPTFVLDYYMKPKRFLLTTSCLNWIPISFLITTFTYIFSSFCAPSQITLGLKVLKELELTFLKSLEIWSVNKGKSSHLLLNSNKFF